MAYLWGKTFVYLSFYVTGHFQVEKILSYFRLLHFVCVWSIEKGQTTSLPQVMYIFHNITMLLPVACVYLLCLKMVCAATQCWRMCNNSGNRIMWVLLERARTKKKKKIIWCLRPGLSMSLKAINIIVIIFKRCIFTKFSSL